MCKVRLHETGNKYVMEDINGNEYYFMPRIDGMDNGDGKWMPGYKHGKHFTWDYPAGSRAGKDKNGFWFEPGRFCAARRTFKMITGQSKQVRLTRYTYGTFKMYKHAPKGKNGQFYMYKALKECNRAIYYDGERFWQACDLAICNAPRPCGSTCRKKYFNETTKPFSGLMWDCWEAQSEQQGIPVVSIWCNDGKPYELMMDGEKFAIADGEWQAMYEQVLNLRGV